MTILSEALRLAKDGVAVFPCVGKTPATPNGYKDASTDPAQIKTWFDGTDFALALVPFSAGWIVLDVDLGADVEIVKRLPPTFTVRTPSGGFHYYYGTEEAFGNRDLAHHINVRCASGYVMSPPTDGYTIISRAEMAELPMWAGEILRGKRPDTIETHDAVPYEELKATLSHIDPGMGYQEWARVLAAIAATPLLDRADDLRDQLALDWSMGRLGAFGEPANACGDDYDMSAKLASFGNEGVGYATLVWLAMPTATTAIPDDMQPDRFTVERWVVRTDIKESVPLIGPLTTHSRTLLVAPTGKGKTHWAMAIAFAIASGKTLLPHWKVAEPKRVLYIDGEMPPTLMKERIIEAAARVGIENLKGRLTFYSARDFPEGIPAMEGFEGQAFVDEAIKDTKAEYVVFDNIQALTTGDMKDTDSWRAVQKFCRKLTERGIGQLWVHHANRDGSMYGDKTRGYQFDTVMSLHSDEDAEEGKLNFDLGYQKTRDRTPHNTKLYAGGHVTLDASGWTFVSNGDMLERQFMETVPENEAYTISELADLFGISRMSANKNANGKWSRFVIPGSKPKSLRWSHVPEEEEGF